LKGSAEQSHDCDSYLFLAEQTIPDDCPRFFVNKTVMRAGEEMSEPDSAGFNIGSVPKKLIRHVLLLRISPIVVHGLCGGTINHFVCDGSIRGVRNPSTCSSAAPNGTDHLGIPTFSRS
jgi:hypothetical protein